MHNRKVCACDYKESNLLTVLTTVWTDSTFESDRILIDQTDQTDQTDQSDSDCREQLASWMSVSLKFLNIHGLYFVISRYVSLTCQIIFKVNRW